MNGRKTPLSPQIMRVEAGDSHPLELFFDYRASMHNIDHNIEIFSEISFIQNIPVLDKPKRTILSEILAVKKHRLERTFKEFGLDTVFNLTETLETPQSIKNSRYYDSYINLKLGYFAFTYFLDKNSKKDEEILTWLIRLLKMAVAIESKFTTFTNYVFKKIICKAFIIKQEDISKIEIPPQQKEAETTNDAKIESIYSQRCISSILDLIINNSTITKKNSSSLYHFFKYIKETKNEILISDMKLAILHMTIKEYPVIVSGDAAKIISILSEFVKELDTISLQIVSRLTFFLTPSMTSEMIMLLPIPLISAINAVSNSNSADFIDHDYLNEETPERVSFTSLPLRFYKLTKPQYSLEKDFKFPDISIVEPERTLESVIPENVLDACLKISKCLMESDSYVFDLFLLAYIPMLETSRGIKHHLDICAAFTFIASKLTLAYSASDLLGVLLKTAVFNPNVHIFNKKEPLNEIVNIIRDTLLYKVIQLNQKTTVRLLGKISMFPLLFAEFLLRIIKDFDLFDITIFTDPTLLHSIIENAHMLFNMQEKKDVSQIDIVSAREINFIFIFMLAEHKETQCMCLSSNFFTDGFLWFIFEPDMTERIIHLIRDSISKVSFSYSLEMTASYICLLFRSFQANIREDEDKKIYLSVAEKLATELVTGLHINDSGIVQIFNPILRQMIMFSQEIYSPTIVESSFRFLDILSKGEKEVSINIPILKYLTKAVRNCYKDEPPAIIRSHIQFLLSGNYLPLGDSSFLIKCTSAIPLLISCFSSSRMFESILKQLYSLCTTSSFNCSALHDGDLDLILLEFLSKRDRKTTVLYNDVELYFSVEDDRVIELMFSLLMEITVKKSNPCIVSKFVSIATVFPKKDGKEYVDSTAITTCRAISTILQRCTSKPIPCFPFGTLHPQFVVTNIPISDLLNGFTIHFQLFVDIKAHEEAHSVLNIFTFKDFKGTTLSFKITGHTINVVFETAEAESEVQFDKKIPKNWFDFAVVCKFSYDYSEGGSTYQDIIMKPYIDGKPDLEYTLGSEPFSGKNLSMIVGGSSGGNRSHICTQIGSIGDIRIINKALDDQGVQNLLHAERNKSIEVFSSNSMSFDSTQSESASKHSSEPNNKVSVTKFSGVEEVAEHDFLWCFVDSGFVNDLTRFFTVSPQCTPEYPEYILDIISLIFTVSTKSQMKFRGVSAIQNFLITRPDVLGWNIFSCTYSTLELIENKSLFVEWMMKIVLNCWIWTQCNESHPLEMIHIFKYFTHFIFNQFKDTLKTVSNLSMLLDQFYLFFCFRNEEEFLQGKDEKPIYESEHYKEIKDDKELVNIDAILKCRDLFFDMICSIIPIKCDRFDIQTIIIHMCTAQGKTTKFNFMKFLCCIPSNVMSSFNQREETLTMLRPLLALTDIEMVATCIYLIIKLSIPETLIYLSLSTIMMVKYVPLVDLFNYLIDYMKTLPDLNNCLSQIAVAVKGDAQKKLTEAYGIIGSDPEKYPITYCNNWFISAILFAITSCNNEEQKIIGKFIGNNIARLKGEQQKTDLKKIFILIDVLFAFSEDSSESLTISILNVLNTQKNLDPSICSTLICSIFMHMNKRTHNDALLNYWKQSCFFNGEFTSKPETTTHIHDIRSPDAFDIFMCSNFDGFIASFVLNINEEEKWIDADKAKVVSEIISHFQVCEPSVKHYNLFISNILRDNKDFSIEMEETYKKLNAIIDSENHKYKEVFSNVINEFRVSIHRSITKAHQLADCKTNYSQSSDKRAELQKEYSLMSNLKIFANIQEVKALGVNKQTRQETFTRDNTVCPYLCPMKLKKVVPKMRTHTERKGQVLYSHKCVLIKFNGTHDYIFKLYKNFIVLEAQDRDKVIPTDQIYMVLTRRIQGRETGIEIFTLDKHSYLIDFVDVEHPEVINSLFLLNMKNIQILQRMVSLETFARMKLTHKWVNGLISNFEYVINMNIFAGRSFNDPVMYPIFPSVLESFDDNKKVTLFDHCKHWGPPLLDRLSFPHSKAPISPLDETLVNSRLIAPEFYYFPHVIDSRDTLPKWASSKFEFVYLHRKLFESDRVSSMLHQWIDIVFGMRSLHINNRQLFRTPHPRKIIPTKDVNFNDLQVDTEIGSKQIIYTSLIQQDPYVIKYQTIFDDGTINYIEVIFKGNTIRRNSASSSEVSQNTNLLSQSSSTSTEEDQFSFPVSMSLNNVSSLVKQDSSDVIVNQYKKFGFVGKGKIICDSYNGFLALVSKEQQTISFVHNYHISEPSILSLNTSIIAAGDKSLIYCPNRTTVSMIHIKENRGTRSRKNSMTEEEFRVHNSTEEICSSHLIDKHEVMCRVRSPIYCICYGPMFDVFVVCTANHIATIYNSRTKVEQCSFDCKEAILNAMITNSFGFIVIRCINSIIILSIDGEFIKRVPLNAELNNWWQFTDSKGFDYIVFQDAENKIGFFEAFYPEKINYICQTRSHVCHITFNILSECIVILTQDGLIQFTHVDLD